MFQLSFFFIVLLFFFIIIVVYLFSLMLLLIFFIIFITIIVIICTDIQPLTYHSLSLTRAHSWAGFSPEMTQIFSGVTACVSQLGLADSLSVWAMVTYHGGKVTLQFNKSCTHLIVGKPDGVRHAVLGSSLFWLAIFLCLGISDVLGCSVGILSLLHSSSTYFVSCNNNLSFLFWCRKNYEVLHTLSPLNRSLNYLLWCRKRNSELCILTFTRMDIHVL